MPTQSTTVLPVILCGGSGTRLWPVSRKSLPKQFVPMVGGKSLLELTLERVLPLADRAQGVVCVGAEEHRFLLREAIGAAGARGTVLLESVARNTAAAMALAALHARSADPVMLFCPADHHIPDVAAFAAMIRGAHDCAQAGGIVTFGVLPTFPSTGYGYIEKGPARATDGGFTVERFIEKPDSARAQELLLHGNFLWNAGIYLCRASVLLKALQQHAPDIVASCQDAMTGAAQDGDFVRPAAEPLHACRSESIDYAVMERQPGISVFPFAGLWSDVGSWNAVADMCPPDEAGNRLEGQGVAINARNNFVHAPHRCVVALGIDDLIIIDTPDAVLVTRRGTSEDVKTVVDELQRRGFGEAVDHRKVMRPWGSYDCVDSGPRFQVKRIVVKPSASISLQKHFHRSEHWVVVRGTAEVMRGDETFLVTENESTYIPLGVVHRLRNPGKTALEMIEVQSGSYLGEDDIVRMEDSYGRVAELRDAGRMKRA